MTIGKDLLSENFQPRTFSRKKTSKTAHSKHDYEKVVIDLDGDNLDDVIIIDVTESFQKKLCGSNVMRKHRKYPIPCVISIDDEDEINDVADPTYVAGSNQGRSADGRKCKKIPVSGHFPSSTSFKCDECLFTYGKKSAFKFSKCRQTFSTNACGRSCYCAGPNLASDSLDSDCSDCEIMEGSFVQWEKASVKRKEHLWKDRSTNDGRTSASSNKNINVGKDIWTKEYSVDSGYSVAIDGLYREETMFFSSAADDREIDDPDFDLRTDDCWKEYSQNLTGSGQQTYSEGKDTEYQHAAQTHTEDFPISTGWKSYDNTNGVSLRSNSMTGCYDHEKSNQEHGRVPSDCNFSDKGPFRSKTAELNLDSEEIYVSDAIHDRAKYHHNGSCLSTSRELSEDSDRHCAGDGDCGSSGLGDIINKREKLKESNEYKQAMEEEWASRHRQLKIQQEEAQRLRKKKKAESMHLLDMERRLKQRVEEVRETQKKDEEKMYLKEQLRIEIRNELSKLESTSHDMVSLLQGLGIQVGRGIYPTSHEVHAAYKRALLKFHPDRASNTDIRRQVEAEEKFKLIALMKEKFLLT